MAPTLTWTPPEGTTAVVVIVDDPDAPRGTFVHWAVAVNDAVSQMGPDVPARAVTAANDFGVADWRGPCPPVGDGPHTYRFRVWALADIAAFDQAIDVDRLRAAIQSASVLGADELDVSYERTG